MAFAAKLIDPALSRPALLDERRRLDVSPAQAAEFVESPARHEQGEKQGIVARADHRAGVDCLKQSLGLSVFHIALRVRLLAHLNAEVGARADDWAHHAPKGNHIATAPRVETRND